MAGTSGWSCGPISRPYDFVSGMTIMEDHESNRRSERPGSAARPRPLAADR